MKTRHGFVSNSSVSSFILIVEKEAYDKVMPTLHPYVQAVIGQIVCGRDCLGKPCVVVGTWFDGASQSFSECLKNRFSVMEPPIAHEGNVADAFDSYRAAVEKAYPDKVFYYED